MKLVLLIYIGQSVICVCFSHEFNIFRFIVFLGYIYIYIYIYIYEIEILWHDI